MPPWFYFARPTNKAFHDLTTYLQPPRNLRSLLGLGAKFIPTPRYSHPSTYLSKDDTSTLSKFYRDLQLRCYFAPGLDNDNSSNVAQQDDDEYNPRMYINSKWTPPPWSVPPTLQVRYDSFKTRIQAKFIKRRGISNLLPHQRRTLSWLQAQDTFAVINCDKNLGPAIIEKRRYCDLVLEHLTSTGVYTKKTPAELRTACIQVKGLISAWQKRNRSAVSKTEMKYLSHSIANVKHADPWSTFYITMKVHKNPIGVRPVVSYPGSLCHSLGVWADDKLKKVAVRQRSYFKSSYVLLQELLTLRVPPHAKLFTADAEAMYTNIPTRPALQVISQHLREHEQRYPDVPRKALYEALAIVMKNNYFTFGDTCWKQNDGAAMGAPPSPSWATVFFAPHEDACCDLFSSSILIYKRFIDDVFGIWIGEDNNEWEAFQQMMNSYHGLKWIFSDLCNRVNFMDLTLSIDGDRIRSTLYEKELNHHLYIPPHSAHPPGMQTGLIHGLVFRIITLCTNENDIHTKVQQSFRHLLNRGYTADKIRPIYHAAIANAYKYTGDKRQTPIDNRKILFRLDYHPQDPPSSTIQKIWRKEIRSPPNQTPLTHIVSTQTKRELGLDQMVVCYSRPHNLGNLLSQRRFAFSQGPPVSSFLRED